MGNTWGIGELGGPANDAFIESKQSSPRSIGEPWDLQ